MAASVAEAVSAGHFAYAADMAAREVQLGMKQLQADAAAIDELIDIDSLPLWTLSPHARTQDSENRSKTMLLRDVGVWGFWLRWREGMLAGRPLDWELQRDVALIPDEDWQKGPAHIAGLIAVIEERHRLLALVADLKSQLSETTQVQAAVATPEHRSHNQPPELIDAPLQLREAVTVIRIALNEAETELVKPDPAPSTLSRIAETLAAAVKTVVLWCAGKIDVFVTEAAKEAGKAVGGWGVKALIASTVVAAASGPMQSLIKGLADLATRLAN
jgi:hypothetical protein